MFFILNVFTLHYSCQVLKKIPPEQCGYNLFACNEIVETPVRPLAANKFSHVWMGNICP